MRAVLSVAGRAGACLVFAVRAGAGLTHAVSALDVLSALGRLRIIDLSHPLHSGIPYWPGAGYGPFRYTPINVLERDGKAAGVFEMPEHMGTHIDAPNHFVDSLESVDRLALDSLLRPAVVLDISSSALLCVDDIQAWEVRHGPISSGALALVRSGWGARWTDPGAFQNGMRFPSVSEDAARVLVLERGVVGIGVDTLSADDGDAPNSPCHRLVHGAGAYILENLANLELLPARGAFVWIAPLPIVGGTGAPARVLAFCDAED